MSQSAQQIIHAEFESALSGLIECYADEIPAVELTALADVAETSAAVVGFGDVKFRGTAVILATESTAKMLAVSTPLNPEDWLGELGNQLVGRLKNKLAAYGVLPQMGAPVTVCGRHLGFSAVGCETASWSVRWSSGSLQAMLTLHVDEDLELTLDESYAIAEEGSLSLF